MVMEGRVLGGSDAAVPGVRVHTRVSRPLSVKSKGGGTPCLSHEPLIPSPFSPFIPPCPPNSSDLQWFLILQGGGGGDAAARSAAMS